MSSKVDPEIQQSFLCDPLPAIDRLRRAQAGRAGSSPSLFFERDLGLIYNRRDLFIMKAQK